MRTDLTDITVVMDRSGSMQSCRQEAESGLNDFIQKQQKEAGDANFTLVQFNTEYEFIHKGVPLSSVEHCSLVPSGMTALLDAVGRAIVETGERLKTISENDRPGLVVFVILTDGLENSSHEYTREKIKQMIEHQQSVYKWQFTYLGANHDAFAEGASYGISQNAIAGYEEKTSDKAFAAASNNVGRMRHAVASGQEVNCCYTPREREEMVGSSSSKTST